MEQTEKKTVQDTRETPERTNPIGKLTRNILTLYFSKI